MKRSARSRSNPTSERGWFDHSVGWNSFRFESEQSTIDPLAEISPMPIGNPIELPSDFYETFRAEGFEPTSRAENDQSVVGNSFRFESEQSAIDPLGEISPMSIDDNASALTSDFYVTFRAERFELTSRAENDQSVVGNSFRFESEQSAIDPLGEISPMLIDNAIALPSDFNETLRAESLEPDGARRERSVRWRELVPFRE